MRSVVNDFHKRDKIESETPFVVHITEVNQKTHHGNICIYIYNISIAVPERYNNCSLKMSEKHSTRAEIRDAKTNSIQMIVLNSANCTRNETVHNY